MFNSVRPHRRQPTRLPRPWDSPGKNTGASCHFLLQCMKVKSESEVVQSCPTLSDPMDCSLPGSSTHRIFQARVLEWGAIAFSDIYLNVVKRVCFILCDFYYNKNFFKKELNNSLKKKKFQGKKSIWVNLDTGFSKLWFSLKSIFFYLYFLLSISFLAFPHGH